MVQKREEYGILGSMYKEPVPEKDGRGFEKRMVEVWRGKLR